MCAASIAAKIANAVMLSLPYVCNGRRQELRRSLCGINPLYKIFPAVKHRARRPVFEIDSQRREDDAIPPVARAVTVAVGHRYFAPASCFSSHASKMSSAFVEYHPHMASWM